MRPLLIYTDSSVIGGCEDAEFARDSIALWALFVQGVHTLALSEHTIKELELAPKQVRDHIERVPNVNQILLADSDEAFEIADAYLRKSVLGPGSRADALHVALATVGRVDVLVSWNFKHMVNIRRIRLFHAANVELGYNPIEIRTPAEVLDYD